MQNKYWTIMTDKKFAIFYLSKYFEESVRKNRIIKIIGAVASCTSIAAWTIWENCAFIWGAIIAVSQVITAINEFLPYQKRIEEISNLKSEWEKIYFRIEEKWFYVSHGMLTEKEINDLISNFDKEWNDVSDQYFSDDVLPQKDDYERYAQNEYIKYFNRDRFGDVESGQ